MKRSKRHNKRAQNLIEYAIVVAVITAAMAAMSTYVYRAVQATKQQIDQEYKH